MALGDGIRRNILSVDPTERTLFRGAILALNHRYFPGTRADAVPGGVSIWFKQDEIHQATHVHDGPAFLPWHRELCNRFEQSLRQIDPRLSLHYWDWNQDAAGIFTADLMGNANGDAGEPFLSEGFYVPGADPYRGDAFDPAHANPADPPRTLTRDKSPGAPAVGSAGWPTDADILAAPDYPTMRGLLEAAHDRTHGYIGGTIGNPHTSFRDPFVFLLHSNVDRLLAMWQAAAGAAWRLDPALVYGAETSDSEILEVLNPWAGTDPSYQVRPWAPPENQQVAKHSRHISVVVPPCYDTLPTQTSVVEAENPGGVITFNDVPETETAARAALFRVFGCGDITLRVRAGTEPSPPFDILSASHQVTVHHALAPYTEARLWFVFAAGAVGTAGTPVPDQMVTIECPQNGQSFDFILRANTIQRTTCAVMLALDQSGSMDDPAGTTGSRRLDVLKDAAARFVQVIQPDNGVGLIRFDHDAYAVNDATWPGLPVTRMGAGDLDPHRNDARAAVLAHATNPAGATSVGDGVALARNTMNTVPAGEYSRKAIITFTDGLENRPLSIDAVTGSIDDRTYVIGLGNEDQVNTEKLNALTYNTGGYLLLTGLLSSSVDHYYLTSKYFLQILAGVTNTSLVKDPSGWIAPGTKLRIPFTMADTDIDLTAIVLQDLPVIRFNLETPDHEIIDPGVAGAIGGTFSQREGALYYRLNLPVPVGPSGQHAGQWHALLEVDAARFGRYVHSSNEDKIDLSRALTHGARYSLIVESLSNLRLEARVEQTGFAPGSTLTARAILTEFGVPLLGRASARAELTHPGGVVTTLPLTEVSRGVFEGGLAAVAAGVYRFRILVEGTSYRGKPFTREHLATAGILAPGSRGEGTSTGNSGANTDRTCRMLACLLSEPTVQKKLDESNIDAKRLAEHLRRCCTDKAGFDDKKTPAR